MYLTRLRIVENTEPESWVLGRVPQKSCSSSGCTEKVPTIHSKYCDHCRPRKKKTVFRVPKSENKISDSDKIAALNNTGGNIKQALFSLGLNDSGENYRMMKKLYATVYPHATNVLKG